MRQKHNISDFTSDEVCKKALTDLSDVLLIEIKGVPKNLLSDWCDLFLSSALSGQLSRERGKSRVSGKRLETGHIIQSTYQALLGRIAIYKNMGF